MEAVRPEVGYLPPAEKQRGRQARHHNCLQEVREEEHPELHSAVLHKVPDDLRLAFRQVKGKPPGFGQGSGHEHEKGHRLGDDAPERKPAANHPPLGPHQLSQVHGPIDHDHSEDGEAQRDLIGDHLRSGP